MVIQQCLVSLLGFRVSQAVVSHTSQCMLNSTTSKFPPFLDFQIVYNRGEPILSGSVP